MVTIAHVLLVVVGGVPGPLSAEEVFKKASPSVVFLVAIEGEDRAAQGSGVVVDRHTVVTNWHVVKSGRILAVKSASGEVSPAVLIAEDEDRDLAVLRVLGAKLTPTRARAKGLAVGQTVFAIGAPEGLELTLSQGIVSQLRKLEGGTLIQTSAPISHGSSGGGLFDDRGELMGITTLSIQKGQSLNFAIPAESAFALTSRGFTKRAVERLCGLSTELTDGLVNELSKGETRKLAQLQSQFPCDGDVGGGPSAEPERALRSTMLEKWRHFVLEQGKLEIDGDWVAGFLASRELRDCRCVRPIPGEVVRRLESRDRLSQLDADDEENTRCELCLLDSFPRWKVRSQKQCALAMELSEFELGVLLRSDDRNGFPPRCAEAAKQNPQRPTSRTGAQYIITKTPDPVAASGDFLRPSDYAPIPVREDGRVYVRVFTASTCVAEVLPGPVTARTGDLLPVPSSAKEITVRGACGGFAEIYFGKEEKPRVSESFARNQPLRLQFRP